MLRSVVAIRFLREVSADAPRERVGRKGMKSAPSRPYVHPSPGLTMLEIARQLVGSGWCQGADARNADGHEVDPWDPSAICWSLLGALVAALEREAERAGTLALEHLAAALSALADVLFASSLVDWNDSPDRSQQEVVDLLAEAADHFLDPWPDVPPLSDN
jgi:hypothetical protein